MLNRFLDKKSISLKDCIKILDDECMEGKKDKSHRKKKQDKSKPKKPKNVDDSPDKVKKGSSNNTPDKVNSDRDKHDKAANDQAPRTKLKNDVKIPDTVKKNHAAPDTKLNNNTSNKLENSNDKPDKKLNIHDKTTEKKVEKCQTELDALAQEFFALRSEVTDLKSQLAINNEMIDDACLDYAISVGECTPDEARDVLRVKSLLKLEEELYTLENNNLMDSLDRSFREEEKQRREHEKALSLMSEGQYEELEQIHNDFQEKIHSYSSKVMKLEHELRVEKAVHEVNEKEMKKKIQSVLNKRVGDMEFITQCIETKTI